MISWDHELSSHYLNWASLVAQPVKNLPAMKGNGNPLQYSSLENFMDREAWWVTVERGYKESDTTEQLTFSTLP